MITRFRGPENAGFRIAAVEASMPPKDWRGSMPEETQRPMMLLILAEKVTLVAYRGSTLMSIRAFMILT